VRLKRVIWVRRLRSNSDQIVIAIRGTYFAIEWLIDFEISMTPFSITGSGQVEDGFYSVFSTLSFFDENQNSFDLLGYLKNLLGSQPQTSIVFAGHSLGSAIVSMLAVQYGADSHGVRNAGGVYTFAAPARGDASFSTFYGNNAPVTYRYWNPLDAVPSALQPYGFSQTAGSAIEMIPTVEQLERYDFLSVDCNHSLMTYQCAVG
jgi:predicted lipase